MGGHLVREEGLLARSTIPRYRERLAAGACENQTDCGRADWLSRGRRRMLIAVWSGQYFKNRMRTTRALIELSSRGPPSAHRRSDESNSKLEIETGDSWPRLRALSAHSSAPLCRPPIVVGGPSCRRRSAHIDSLLG
jgi:hypothetical protein